MQKHLFEKTATEKFNEYDRANPNVYRLFEQFTFELLQKGHKNIGTGLIIERIRWESAIQTDDPNSVFKINNNYAPHYARKFVRKHPQFTNVFRFRQLRKV